MFRSRPASLPGESRREGWRVWQLHTCDWNLLRGALLYHAIPSTRLALERRGDRLTRSDTPMNASDRGKVTTHLDFLKDHLSLT